MRRREFVAAAGALAALPWRGLTGPAWTSAVGIRVSPFPLAQVKLLPGPFLDAALVNRRFLLGQDADRLLHTFRLTAGLRSTAEPIWGWEAPENELRGHYTGHYLSACSLLAASGDAEAKARGDQIVAALAECQKGGGTGYLSAFPEEFFDRLRADRPVWAPWYTIHKLMAGLLDMHVNAGSDQALDVVKGMARWTARWTQPLGEAHMARVLEREYGGMNELLYNLAAVTGNEEWRDVAHRFDHERIFAPLARGRDELKGLHVNTTIPKIIGAARRFELTGDGRAQRIAEFFWRTVTEDRAYATGGTSNGESWNTEPGILAAELSGYTQECCVTYNMLKLTRHLFTWDPDPRLADYYERALLNGVLGTQHPSDGSKLYYVPLASGFWKLFGDPLHDYWCCTGSGSESFAKLGDSIYFRDEAGVFVNLFIASELRWPERNLTLVQDTKFPDQEGSSFTFKALSPVAMKLRIRIPYWVGNGGSIRLNGKSVDGFAGPSSYFVLDRTWHDGDRVEISLPMSLHSHQMPDDSTLQAPMYGPLVLAAEQGTDGLTPDVIRAEPTKPRTVPEYRRDGLATPSLRAPGGDLAAAVRKPNRAALDFEAAEGLRLQPLNRVLDQRYAVYFKTV